MKKRLPQPERDGEG